MLEIPPQSEFYVQIVVFFVFAAILAPLILRPTQEVLARRAEQTDGARREAATMEEEVAAMSAEFEKSLAEARRAGASGGEEIRREAEAAEREVLGAAREEAAQTLESIRQEIGEETAAARTNLENEANALARTAADKILGRTANA